MSFYNPNLSQIKDYGRGLREFFCSNYDFKSWGKKPSETNFWVDTDKDGFLLIKISYDTHGDGTGGMGWLEYDYKTFRLFDMKLQHMRQKQKSF